MRNTYVFAVLTFVLASALSLIATAQTESQQQGIPDQNRAGSTGNMHRDRSPEARLDWLNQQLNLTDEQKEKLRPILADESKQIKAVWDDTLLTQDQKHAKTKLIKESTRPQIEAVLTPEQREKFAQIKEEAKERHTEKKDSGKNDLQPPKQ
jgi:Spy/CpxP family protein refolding chaperone